MFREATSGAKVAAGLTRSSTLMVAAPPVVMFTTQSERCLITCRNGANASVDWSGRPSTGLRAWRWTMAAPASPLRSQPGLSLAPSPAGAATSRRMDRSRYSAGDDDLVLVGHFCKVLVLFDRALGDARNELLRQHHIKQRDWKRGQRQAGKQHAPVGGELADENGEDLAGAS